jgi:hypothetical protein
MLYDRLRWRDTLAVVLATGPSLDKTATAAQVVVRQPAAALLHLYYFVT